MVSLSWPPSHGTDCGAEQARHAELIDVLPIQVSGSRLESSLSLTRHSADRRGESWLNSLTVRTVIGQDPVT